MRPSVISKTGTGSSSIVPMDIYLSPFNVSITTSVSGTVNYDIQHTNSDIWDASVTPVWASHPTLTGLTAAADGNYAFPVRAIKILVNSGSGTANAIIVQAGAAR